MSDGFLGRWSRRKQELREGKPLGQAPSPADSTAPATAAANGAAVVSTAVAPQAVAEPPPTLEDARALVPSSDFTPFMAQGVSADVRNAAVKKLFTDPHYNVMDGLDIYIDDYSQADPLPAAMLRQMASAKFLNLFDDPEHVATQAIHDLTQPATKPSNTSGAGDDADTPPSQDVAQSGLVPKCPILPVDATTPGAPASTETQDAHPDLRLQPDDAPQREGAGPGAA